MSVEFLPSDVPGDAPENSPRRPERAHRPGGWVLVALLALGAVIWALTRPESAPSPPQAAAPTPGSTATPTPDRVVTLCHGIPRCRVHNHVPSAVVRLARTYLPQPADLHVQTVVAANSLTHADQLVRRDIAATAGSVTVVIRVQRGGSGSQAIVPDPPGIGSAIIVAMNSGYVVRLQYLAPEGVPPVVAKLRAFIHDPRLVRSS